MEKEKMIEVILGRVAEAIYFSLFLIFTKKLKNKRFLFVALMIAEYLLLYELFPYNTKFQISYTIMTYIILKVLYKKEAQITDIFTFSIASIYLIVTSAFAFLLFKDNMIKVAIFNRIILFSSLFVFRKKLPKIQATYKKLWNRNDNVEKKIKSVTFRGLNIVLFNIMFYVINLGMMYAIWFNNLK